MDATRHLAQGKRPYLAPGYYNPPWLLIPLLPFAYLPPSLSFALWSLLSFAGYGLLGYKLKVSRRALAATLLSYPVLQGLLFGQVDWLVLLGIFLPRPLGFLWLSAKPQITGAILLLWLYEAGVATCRGNKLALPRLLAPTLLAGLASVALYGFWFNTLPVHAGHNSSLFPYSLLALPLLGKLFAHPLIRQGKYRLFVFASPLLTPFLSIQSWGSLILTAPTWLAVTLSTTSWIIALIH